MEFNRKAVKQQAREAMGLTHPRPSLVALVYLLAVSLVSFLLQIVPMLPALSTMMSDGYYYPTSVASFGVLGIFTSVLVLLYSMVVGVGFVRYTMKVWRGQPAGYGDLFSAFSLVGRVLALNLLIFLFIFLWTMLAMVVMTVLWTVAALTSSYFVLVLVGITSYVGFLVLLINRTLRYMMANYLLLDRPESGALELLRESKRILQGRLWSYFLLNLSFIGWYLLMFLIMWLLALGGLYLSLTLGLGQGGILVALVMAFLAMCALGMWVMAYAGVATAGFYDTISARPTPPVAEEVPGIPTYLPPVIETPAPQPTEPPPVPPTPAPPAETPVPPASEQPEDSDAPEEPEL